MDRVSQACANYDLTISNTETEVVYQQITEKPFITVNWQRLQAVNKCIYLGSALSKAVRVDDEVTVPVCHLEDFAIMSDSGMESDLTLNLTSTWLLLYACQSLCPQSSLSLLGTQNHKWIHNILAFRWHFSILRNEQSHQSCGRRIISQQPQISRFLH